MLPNPLADIGNNMDFFYKLALSLLIGVLIGIERERKAKEEGVVVAGVRSFTLACLIGMLSSYIAYNTSLGNGVLLVALVFFGVFSALFLYVKNVVYKQAGITGPMAFFSTFLLGILITYNMYLFAIIGGIVLTLLLAEKQPLHSFATRLTQEEIIGAVRFLALVFILYPVMPNMLILDVINPRSVLLIVIFVTSLSFLSFFIMKNMGASMGIQVSGLLGGLVNSEATTGALAAMAKKRGDLTHSCSLGIILSNASMLIRNLAIALIVDPGGRFLMYMAPPQLVTALAAIAITTKSRNSQKQSETLTLQSPFTILPAIQFALGFTGLAIIAKFANEYAGTAGILTLALGGLISSAAVTASMATMVVSGQPISYITAALVAVLAGIVSTGSKIGLVRWSGSRGLSKEVNRILIFLMGLGSTALVIWAIFLLKSPS